jgi:hypothetical protein
MVTQVLARRSKPEMAHRAQWHQSIMSTHID